MTAAEDRAANPPPCEHHWVHRAQPDYPEWLSFIAHCSQCGRFGELDIRDGWTVTTTRMAEDGITAREAVEAPWPTVAAALRRGIATDIEAACYRAEFHAAGERCDVCSWAVAVVLPHALDGGTP